ncbi:hypothetical protein [Azospirillum largimobile]
MTGSSIALHENGSKFEGMSFQVHEGALRGAKGLKAAARRPI